VLNWEYKSISVKLKLKSRWSDPEVDTDELDKVINEVASLGWEFVSLSIVTSIGYPRSAVCVFKKESR
jgi:hypothetical protein